jgi:transposase-like protein
MTRLSNDTPEPRIVRQVTLKQFDRLFPDEEACRTYLFNRRWPDGVRCARCNNDRVYACKAPRLWHWQCKQCGKNSRSPYRFALTTGTIFEESKYPLLVWFKVMFFMLTSKKGMSALQIHRMVGTGSYRTAWYMCMRLRAGLKDPEFVQLMGIVEVDETYIGGKDKNRHFNKKSRQQREAGTGTGYLKVGVIGAIERKGNVVCRIIGSAAAPPLAGFVRTTVSNKVSLVATDDNQEYNHLGRGIRHESVNHSSNEYVRGEVHTNSIESFWSLLKRGVVGTYHNVSAKYLPLYLNEFQFRFNNRNNEDIFGEAIGGC